MPVTFIAPGDTINRTNQQTGFFTYDGATQTEVLAPGFDTGSAGTFQGFYHTQANGYFTVGNALPQGINDATFTQAIVGGWLSDIIEVDGFNIQAQLQTALSDGVLTDSELLLLQFAMDQYALEVQASTNILNSMKTVMSSIVQNLR